MSKINQTEQQRNPKFQKEQETAKHNESSSLHHQTHKVGAIRTTKTIKLISKTKKTRIQRRRNHTTPPVEHIRMRESFETKAPWSKEATENKDDNDEKE